MTTQTKRDEALSIIEEIRKLGAVPYVDANGMLTIRGPGHPGRAVLIEHGLLERLIANRQRVMMVLQEIASETGSVQ